MKTFMMDEDSKLVEVEPVESEDAQWGLMIGIWAAAVVTSVVLWFLFIWATVACLKAWGLLT